MPETPQDTARRRRLEQRSLTGAGAADIARGQEESLQPLRQGYTRGVEPAPPTRQIGPAPQPAGPSGLSTGFISSAEKERRRREKVARGEPLTQEDL
ncbi:MAG: hypothetical protein ACRDZ4_10915 [Egibacteraceae bacterium]